MKTSKLINGKIISPNVFWVVLWLLYCFFIFVTYFFSGLCFYLWDSNCFYWNSLVGKIFWRTSSWLPRNDIRLASEFLRSRAIQCIFKEDGDMETFFWIRCGPCSGISIYLTSSSLTLWCLFNFHWNSRCLCCLLFKKRWWGKGGMVLASIVGSGQVICKDFCIAGCTQIGTSSP